MNEEQIIPLSDEAAYALSETLFECGRKQLWGFTLVSI